MGRAFRRPLWFPWTDIKRVSYRYRHPALLLRLGCGATASIPFGMRGQPEFLDTLFTHVTRQVCSRSAHRSIAAVQSGDAPPWPNRNRVVIGSSVYLTVSLCLRDWSLYIVHQHAAPAVGEMYIANIVIGLALLAHLILLRWFVVGIHRHRTELREARAEGLEHQQQLMRT